MSARNILPLIDISQFANGDINLLRCSLLRFGAFRLSISQLNQVHNEVFSEARIFFSQDSETKQTIRGFSPLREECVRHTIKIPKESIYFFEKKPPWHELRDPSAEFNQSMNALQTNWNLLGGGLACVLQDTLQREDQYLAQDIPLHDSTIGVHHYDSRQLRPDDKHYNPPHVDSGWLTVLLREPTGCCDGLEIADLKSTERTESKEVGENATFCPVSTMPGEAVVLAGRKLQKSFRGQVNACVHKVSRPETALATDRLSVAIFF